MPVGSGRSEERDGGLKRQLGRTLLGAQGVAALRGQVGVARPERPVAVGVGGGRGVGGGLRGRGNPTLKRFKRPGY